MNFHCYQVAAILMVAQVTGTVGQTLLSDIVVTSWLLQQTLIATSSYLQVTCRVALVQAAHWRLAYSSPQLTHAACCHILPVTVSGDLWNDKGAHNSTVKVSFECSLSPLASVHSGNFIVGKTRCPLPCLPPLPPSLPPSTPAL